MLSNRRRILTGLAAAAFMLFTAGNAIAQIPDEAITRDLRWRNIGPANMSGRITDIEALDDDYRFVLVASASGGVWKSTNAGTTWEPIFDDYGAASIGSVAIFQPDPNILWVGTGEPNNRNSVAWGDGIYKSTDGGETFTNMGLEDTHQISHVLTHPTDPDIVYVGAIGHLWGYTGDRGVFKTTDGGQTWQRVLYVDEMTGCSALVMDPNNPEVLYAGMYQRLRRPWRFDSGGPNGGIFKTTDGGRNWTKLTQGLPRGDTGKIGLAISRTNPNILNAFVEAEQTPRGGEIDPANPSSGVYRSEDGGQSWTQMNTSNNRPFYYSHIFINPVDENRVYMVTGSFQSSPDGGRTIERMGGGIHGDYHAMWCDPHNKDRFYIGNDGGASLTHDHSQSYIFFDNLPTSQFYAVGVDMRDPYYVYGGLQDNGSWGGPSNSRDRSGILTDHWYNVGGGDGFHAQVDPTDWRTVYVESQGGAISRVDALTRQSRSIRPRDPRTGGAGGGGRTGGGQMGGFQMGGFQQQGNVVNYDDYITDEIIEKQGAAGWRGSAFRFNWSTPIVLSPHNPHTVYFGGNFLFKSVDRGDTWMIISPDLTTDDPVKIKRETGGLTSDVTGAENHCSIITISESPVTPGVIWVGTDDGNVQVTRDGGVNWKNVRSNVPGVPDGIWVSRVEASHFEEGTCYLTFDGHRSDNFVPYAFKTTDYGESWTKITDGIPDGQCVYVIKEDLRNPNLLFLGTEFACYVSLNDGESWSRLMNGMPTVAVHDLVIHPRDNDLIAATHGRGIWIMDDITMLQQYTGEVAESDAHLFEPRTVTNWVNVSRGGSRGAFYFRGENPPRGTPVHFYLKNPGTVTLEISDISGEMKRTAEIDGTAGINTFDWDRSFDPGEQERERFIEQIRQQIERLPEQMELTRAQTRQLNQLSRRLDEASGLTNMELLGLRTEITGITGGGGRGMGGGQYRGGGRAGSLRGPSASTGSYRVTLTVNGETYSTTITIREDPLLGGGN